MLTSLVFVQVLRKKVHFSFIWEYRGTILRTSCDVIDDVITMQIFFLHNLGRSFNTWCQIEAAMNISKNFKMTKFKGWGELFRRKCHRILNTLSKKPRACPTFWAFDRCSSLNIWEVMAISKFDVLFDPMTSSVTSSTPKIHSSSRKQVPYLCQV